MTGSRSHLALQIASVAALLVGPAGSAQTPARTRNFERPPEAAQAVAAAGKYYALVIGVKSYQGLPALTTPVNDAQAVAAVLTDQYGFTTQTLLDANRDQIIEALDKYRRTLNESDSLLIYYAGHGYYDKPEDEAYWAPVDARQDSYSRWITGSDITGKARAIPARHFLIISDSCYSGMFGVDHRAVGQVELAGEQDSWLRKMLQTKSRNVLASGGNEPVSDSDTAGHVANHSVFANALIEALSQIGLREFTTDRLFTVVNERVRGRSDQHPAYRGISNSGDEGGDFVFIRTSKVTAQAGTEAGAGAPAEVLRADVLPPVPVDNPDKDAVNAALNNYEDAYGSMDVRVLRKVWPSLSKTQEKEIKGGFQAPGLNAVKVQLRNRHMFLNGQTATADCDQWMIYTFTGTRQPPQTSSVEIMLAKDDHGNWAVNGVKAK